MNANILKQKISNWSVVDIVMQEYRLNTEALGQFFGKSSTTTARVSYKHIVLVFEYESS